MSKFVKSFLLLILLIALCTNCAFAATYPCDGQILKSAVNVRKKASQGSDQVGKLKRDEIVTVVGEENNGNTVWYEIEFGNGKSGYVRGDLIELAVLRNKIQAPTLTPPPSPTPSPMPTLVAQSNDGLILYRDLPWYSTRQQVEEKLGIKSNIGETAWLYRMSATDYSNVTMGKDRVDGAAGSMARYSNMSVAGYTPSASYIGYIYPIKDGKVIRELNNAQMYFAYYSFTGQEFSDYLSIFDDLKTKLSSIYGKGLQEHINSYSTITWKDRVGNRVRLLINDDNWYITLGYMAADGEARLDEMKAAIAEENRQAEEKKIEENRGNIDGL